MRLLVIDRDSAEGARIVRILGSLGHQVVRVMSQGDLPRALDPVRPPDVAVVVLPDQHVARWLPEVEEASHRRHIYLIGAMRALTSDAVSMAWDLGMDDIFQWGASAEEVAGRVEALSRIRGWIGTLLDYADAGPFDLEQLGSWRELGNIVVRELSALVGPVTLLPAADKRPDPTPDVGLGAEVVLSLPDQHLAVRVGLVLPSKSARGLARAAFGEVVSRSMMSDALREYANTVGGAMKRQALGEGHTFALGLPRNTTARPRSTARRWWLRHTDFELFAWAAVEGTRPRRVAVGTLQEGYVVVQEIRRDNGRLLVAAGTVLTRRTIDKLANAIGEATLVQVARSA